LLADARGAYDDAFITLRDARNVAHHGQWYFNAPGEAVQGATSLLWVLALAPISIFLAPGDPNADAVLIACGMTCFDIRAHDRLRPELVLRRNIHRHRQRVPAQHMKPRSR
jgi:hypothetical protein